MRVTSLMGLAMILSLGLAGVVTEHPKRDRRSRDDEDEPEKKQAAALVAETRRQEKIQAAQAKRDRKAAFRAARYGSKK